MDEDSRVTRSSFRRLKRIVSPSPIPPPNRRWPGADWEQIQAGHQARDMDDKWDAFVEGNRLFLHRSWTSLGIYEADFEASNGEWRIVSAVVEGDAPSYGRGGDEGESLALELIIESVLLSRFHEEGWRRWIELGGFSGPLDDQMFALVLHRAIGST